MRKTANFALYTVQNCPYCWNWNGDYGIYLSFCPFFGENDRHFVIKQSTEKAARNGCCACMIKMYFEIYKFSYFLHFRKYNYLCRK
nr:MAG TPA: hypothetical protein [Caudoviricetes sp.]